jgi:hypothetical protein
MDCLFIVPFLFFYLYQFTSFWFIFSFSVFFNLFCIIFLKNIVCFYLFLGALFGIFSLFITSVVSFFDVGIFLNF